jgi:hypothetical protein
VADVVRLHDGLTLGIEDLLEVVEHCAGSAAAPCRVLAHRVQLLRRIGQPAARIGDLRVRRHGDSVGALDGKDDGHVVTVYAGRAGAALYRTPTQIDCST